MLIAAIAALTSLPAAAEPVTLPSGSQVELHEIIGADSPEIRLRYVSRGFDPLNADSETLLEDMTFLCEGSIPSLSEGEATGTRIIVSIADRPAEFGVLDTDVRQSFEAFTLAGDTCIWEAF